MEGKNVHNTVIIGGGCAGLTAGIYTGRAGLMPLLFAGDISDKGGLLTKTSVVENYPGFADGCMGFDLVDQMERQAVRCGTTVHNNEIISVDFGIRPFKLIDSSSGTHYAKTVIIATGSKPNKLGLMDEDRFWGTGGSREYTSGISSCAVCDGALYKNKKIVVVGGGDSAMEEAQFLTKFSGVVLIHRRDSFRASKVMQEKVLHNPKINIMYNTAIVRLNGTDRLKSIDVKNILTDETSTIEVDGLFYGLGLTPNTKLFKGIVELDTDGYVEKGHHDSYETMTSVEGVFVAGDASDRIYRQAVVAAGDGCRAGLDVNMYLTVNGMI